MRAGFFGSFAVHSPIAARVAVSGAGSAAYRRLVTPGLSMSLKSLSLAFGSFALTLGLLSWPAAVMAEPADAIAVSVDQAKLVKLPSRVATIVVGNPMIADVTLQNGGIVVVTGKGYGATNFIAMDRGGEVLVDRVIQVEGPTDQLVTVYRGVERETYSCMPICQRRVTLGDGDNYFNSVIGQSGSLSNQAGAGAAGAGKAN
jgi:Pilus formation protein N terminal region